MRKWLSLAIVVVALVSIKQTNETKASYYPVTQAPFFGGKAKDFSLVKNGDQWVIVAINDPVPWPPLDEPESAGLPVSTTYDLEHWTYEGIAIPVGAAGSWDDRAVWAPSIIKSGNLWYLYYTGVHVDNGTLVQKIGLATSTDLIHWTKYGSTPVFDCSTLGWNYWDVSDTGNGAACRDPFVIRDEPNGRWVMYFTAALPHIDAAPFTALANPAVIGMAYSNDLVHWNDGGYIAATRGAQAESGHVFEHNGTWHLVFTSDCSFNGITKCLVHSTASSMTGPYSAYQDLPDVLNYYFASEYYKTNDGRELFGYSAQGTIRFADVDWTSGDFRLQTVPTTKVTGYVWRDTNGNGVQEESESGVDDVTAVAYIDNGDGYFDKNTDHFLTRTTTRTSAQVPGKFYFLNILPGLTWIEIEESNFSPTGPLSGFQMSDTQRVISHVTIPNTPNTDYSFRATNGDSQTPNTTADLRTN